MQKSRLIWLSSKFFIAIFNSLCNIHFSYPCFGLAFQDCLFFLQLYTDKKGFTVFHCAKIAVMKNSQVSIVLMNCPRLVALLKEETSFIFI